MYKFVRLIAEDSILKAIELGDGALAALLLESATKEDITPENVCSLCNELNGPRDCREDIIEVCTETNLVPAESCVG